MLKSRFKTDEGCSRRKRGEGIEKLGGEESHKIQCPLFLFKLTNVVCIEQYKIGETVSDCRGNLEAELLLH